MTKTKLHFTLIDIENAGKFCIWFDGTDKARKKADYIGKKKMKKSRVLYGDISDPDLIDMLYTKPRHKPNDGFGASAWNSDY